MSIISWLRKRTSTRSTRRHGFQTRPTAPRFRPRLEALEDRWMPSTLTVTNNLDSGPGSLRAEIAAAQNNDTIVFAPNLAGHTITLTSGELSITKGMTIQGPGASQLTVSGNHATRVFEVNSSQPVVLSGITVSNGRNDIKNDSGSALTISGSTISGSTYHGIFNAGTLTVSGCTIAGNSCIELWSGSGSGGAGIDNIRGGKLTVSDSTMPETLSAATATMPAAAAFSPDGAVRSRSPTAPSATIARPTAARTEAARTSMAAACTPMAAARLP
jgi:hypothetical protein